MHSLILSKVKRQRVRSLSRRILQFVRNARRKCLIPGTGDTCIRSSTVPAADRDLQSWIRFPYDRERTSMKEFPMCPDCAKEYYDPATRRYDAQPVCCNDCGPEVYLIGRDERGREAITCVRKTISEGGIAAVKGNRRISSLLRCFK